MRTQLSKLTVLTIGLTAVMLAGLLPTHANADNRPQAVLDLIAGHQALAMKIRPLRDRVLVARSSESSAEGRAPERLRHKNRAVSDGDEYGRIKVQLLALEQKASTERERVNRPRFGVNSAEQANASGDIRFGDGRRGTRSTADTEEVADARKALAALQRELAALERKLNAAT